MAIPTKKNFTKRNYHIKKLQMNWLALNKEYEIVFEKVMELEEKMG
jgi:hypothetical protein